MQNSQFNQSNIKNLLAGLLSKCGPSGWEFTKKNQGKNTPLRFYSV